MKSIFLILLIFINCASVINQPKLIDEYDEFKDYSIYGIQNLWIKSNLIENIKLDFFINYQGTNFDMPDSIFMYFYSYTKNWRYLDCVTTH